MFKWKFEDPSIEAAVVATREKCSKGQELCELLVRRDGTFTMLHAPLPVLKGGSEKIEIWPLRLDLRLGASMAVASTVLWS